MAIRSYCFIYLNYFWVTPANRRFVTTRDLDMDTDTDMDMDTDTPMDSNMDIVTDKVTTMDILKSMFSKKSNSAWAYCLKA